MAQTSWPFDSIDTTETQFSQWARNIGEGVKGSAAGTELKPYGDSSGMFVKVPVGQAMIRGHYYSNDAVVTLAVSTANATLARIDSVILTLDPTANTVVLSVLAGTASASPVAPTLTQTDASTYQIVLGYVAVAAAVSTITAGNVTDGRTFIRAQPIGTATAAPLQFVAGTNLTTANGGAVEFDGNAFYATPDAQAVSGRAYVSTPHYKAITSARTLTAGVSALQNAVGGSLTLAPNTSYEVEMMIQPSFTTTSATSIDLSVVMSLSLAPISTSYTFMSSYGTTSVQQGAMTSTWRTGQTAQAVVGTAASTSSTIYSNVFVKGLLRTGASGGTGGILSPSVQMSGTNTSAFGVSTNGYIKVTPVGTNLTQTIGAWA